MCSCGTLFYFLLHLVRAQCRGAFVIFGVVCPRAGFRMGCVASHSVVSVSSFNPSHPEGSGVSGRATCIREPSCGVSMLPFPPSFCRVCLLSFGATFGFREAPGELSGLWAEGLGLPFRSPLAVPPPGLPLPPMVVGAVGRYPQAGSLLVSWLVADVGSQALVCCCFVLLARRVGGCQVVSMSVIRFRLQW